jgi:hypothetical protein
MTPITEYPSFENRQEKLLNELKNVIDERVTEVCSRHYEALTQEPALTSRIAQAIESELAHHPINVDGLKVEVTTLDIPDRGANSMESKTGTDLYISLVRHDLDDPISKGMLIQAKWDDTLNQHKKDFRN